MTDLQEAFREAARREFAMVPDESELDYKFSPSFRRKMQRIIHAQIHGYWNMVNTLGKRIAIAAAIIVMLLTTAMAIKPVRERVIKFFIEVYEDCFEINFGMKEKGDIDPTPTSMLRYSFTNLPTGYREVSFIDSNHLLWTQWQDQLGNDIILQQELGTHEIIIDKKALNQIIIPHSDNEYIYHTHENTSLLIWKQDGYVFSMSVTADFSIEQMFTIIDSLTIIY